MIKSIFILVTLSLILIIIASCGNKGPESIDIKSAESTCDCIDLKIEILKRKVSLLENEKSKSVLDSEEYEKWWEKDKEHRHHCREIDKRWHKAKSCENHEKYDDLESKFNKLYNEVNPYELIE